MKFLLLPLFLIVVPVCSIVLRTFIRMGDRNREADGGEPHYDNGGVDYKYWEETNYDI